MEQDSKGTFAQGEPILTLVKSTLVNLRKFSQTTGFARFMHPFCGMVLNITFRWRIHLLLWCFRVAFIANPGKDSKSSFAQGVRHILTLVKSELVNYFKTQNSHIFNWNIWFWDQFAQHLNRLLSCSNFTLAKVKAIEMLAAYGSARMIVGVSQRKMRQNRRKQRWLIPHLQSSPLEKDFDFVKLFWCLLICSTDSQYPKKMVGTVSLFSR